MSRLIRGEELTIADAAERLGISVDNMRQRIKRKGYPTRRQGRNVLVEIPPEELEAAARESAAGGVGGAGVDSDTTGEGSLPVVRQSFPVQFREFVAVLAEQNHNQQIRLEEQAGRIAQLEGQLTAAKRELMTTKSELGATEKRLLRLLKQIDVDLLDLSGRGEK